MRRARQKPKRAQEPLLFDLGTDRVAEVTQRRGQIVSALMKAIRLAREEDAVYWMLALLRGGQDRSYLGRRCFGSACEDNFNLQAIEMGAELARKPAEVELPFLQSVIASSRGPKWYWPMAKAYTVGRCQPYEAPRVFEHTSVAELEALCREALRQRQFVPFFAAYRELKRERKKNLGIVTELVALAKASPIEEARRLATAMAPHLWQCATRETNPVWQLVWILCEGPFPGSNAPVDLTGAEQTIARAEERWGQAVLEPVPSWVLDGVHTSGDDERFAGTWRGLRNMVAMYERYGRLSPEDPGILVRAGEGGRRRKGRWPIIFRSCTHPQVTYQVEPAGDELRCSCPAFFGRFQRGQSDCQHIRQVLAENPDLLEGG
jgi:hypothetical protein